MTVNVETATANYKKLLNIAHKDGKLWKDGLNWYDEAQQLASDIAKTQIQPIINCDYTIALRIAAGLIAVGSPMKEWGQNVKLARQWTAQLGAKTKVTGHMSSACDKAQQIWDAGIRDASISEMCGIISKDVSKTSRFFRNILGDMSYATIDGHMINAAEQGTKFVGITQVKNNKAVIKVCDEALKVAADAYGVSYAQAQAIIWVTYKAQKGEQ